MLIFIGIIIGLITISIILFFNNKTKCKKTSFDEKRKLY